MDRTFALANDASPAALFTAAALTADDYSKAYTLGKCHRFGLFANCSAVGGTAPTLDITVEYSADGGTNWAAAYPDDVNSGTQAALTQLTGSVTAASETWDRAIPAYNAGTRPDSDVAVGAANPEWLVRFKLDTGGTAPSFTFRWLYLVCYDFE